MDQTNFNRRSEVSIIYDQVFETFDWKDKVPFFQFPDEWWVKILPPFMGAVLRFSIKLHDWDPCEAISVYLDGYNSLGQMPYPYWECYPIDGETIRIPLDKSQDLVPALKEEIDRKKNLVTKTSRYKGSKYRFPLDNSVPSCQDFTCHDSSMPKDIVFTLHKVYDNGYAALVAPGFGGEPYGKGALSVRLNDILPFQISETKTS